jgi:hypothetical protein
MNNNLITYKGIIHFDPTNKTKKHELQSDWKRMALVMLSGEICEYYAWFIEKRFNLKLNKPLRNAHLSLINDSVNDIKKSTHLIDEEIVILWETVKNKWDNKEIEVVLDLDIRGNSKHYWMNAPKEKNIILSEVRNEIGLADPYYKFHVSIGYVNEKNREISEYVLKYMINYE